MVRRIDLEPRICEYCGSSYLIRPKTEKPFQYLRRKYCSNKCKLEILGKLSIGRKYSDEYKKKMSETLIKLRKLKPYSLEHNEKIRQFYLGKPKPESLKKKISKTLTGKYSKDKHWNWQGGITELRNRDNDSPEYKQWRKSVFKRDTYKCIRCGNDKSGQLRAHHIKEYSLYPELRYDIDNGLTVCEDCHKEIHYGIKQKI